MKLPHDAVTTVTMKTVVMDTALKNLGYNHHSTAVMEAILAYISMQSPKTTP